MKDIRKYNFFNIVKDIYVFENLSDDKKIENINNKFKKLLKESYKNSKYYKKLYKDINIDEIDIFNIEKLPPTNKLELMNNFNEWITDKEIIIEDVENHIKLKKFNEKFLKKYIIFTTSGTTGTPVMVITHKIGINIELLISFFRIFNKPSDMFRLALKGLKVIAVFPTDIPCTTTYMLTSLKDKYFKNKNSLRILDINTKMSKIVSEMNNSQPLVIGGYCTIIEMLLDEAEKGNLNISPIFVYTLGEKLKDETIERIKKIYPKCKILAMYATTEAGQIGSLCSEYKYHINEDWTIVEPVDNNYNLVKDGVLSDKILITNLWNYNQPFIRYEINDRVIMHHEKCKCGKRGPWLEVEGRSFNIMTFKDKNGGPVRLSPMAIEIMIHKNDEGINRYQFIYIKETNSVEIKLLTQKGYSQKEVFDRMKKDIENYFEENNIKISNILLSEQLPGLDKSGKFLKVFEN